jgi:hypothetical protein
LALANLVANYATDRSAAHCAEHTTADRVTHGRARAGANRRTFFCATPCAASGEDESSQIASVPFLRVEYSSSVSFHG